jgi:beta-glucosidase
LAEHYSSRYIDVEPSPLYPFGYGLGYTSFSFGEPRVSPAVLEEGQTATVELEVTNTGERSGSTVVQLYVRDPVASVSRPVKELRGLERVELRPGERRLVRFTLAEPDLAFWRRDMSFGAEPGMFEVMTGPSSSETTAVRLELRSISPAVRAGTALGRPRSG